MSEAPATSTREKVAVRLVHDLLYEIAEDAVSADRQQNAAVFVSPGIEIAARRRSRAVAHLVEEDGESAEGLDDDVVDLLDDALQTSSLAAVSLLADSREVPRRRVRRSLRIGLDDLAAGFPGALDRGRVTREPSTEAGSPGRSTWPSACAPSRPRSCPTRGR